MFHLAPFCQTQGMMTSKHLPGGCETEFFKRFVSAGKTMRVVYTFAHVRRACHGKRRWRARTPRPSGLSYASCVREASWSAARQRRFGPETGVVAQPEEFCLTPLPGTIPLMNHFKSVSENSEPARRPRDGAFACSETDIAARSH